jgi:carbon monoxide dehydrogenase subunit G
MRVTYSGVIAASADDVWARLADVDTLIGLLPGATLSRNGGQVVGSLKVRPSSQVTYRITAGASLPTEGANSATIAVTGTEARGAGTLAATLSVAVREEEGGSGLAAIADIEATGRVAGADEQGWNRVLARLGNAVVASFERHPAGTPVPIAESGEHSADEPSEPEPAAAAEPEPTARPAPSALPEPVAMPEAPAPPESTAMPEAPAPFVAPGPVAVALRQPPKRSNTPFIVTVVVVVLLVRWLRKRRG